MAMPHSSPCSPARRDLSGQVFGRWTVLRLVGRKRSMSLWQCRCACGTVRTVQHSDLANGHSKSCGCRPRGPNFDLAGKVVGRLTVLGLDARRHGGNIFWLCQCACGKQASVRTTALTGGRTKSCGCLPREKRGGLTTTAEYRCWWAMHRRCENPRAVGYKDYGGRGIKVCEAWASFANFLADMGQKPLPSLSIDRINNDGNYSCGKCPECQTNGWPANCRWATRREQSLNQRKPLAGSRGPNKDRRGRQFPYQGQLLTIAEIAGRIGMDRTTLSTRLKDGWSVERATTTPTRKKTKSLTTQDVASELPAR